MTETIACIAGPYLFLTGLGFLISNGFYRRMIAGQTGTDPILLNLSGAAHFVVGATILANHFLWSTTAEIAVSLTGSAAAIKGAGLIVLPEVMAQRSPQMGKRGVQATGILFIAVGSYLISVGFL
ncbi:hypothetical protein [uncultured Roseobacter sp.]|uniref:hypothetical protein n=1 Tax=uncultured Roseobacter sp. TaxID=114847 RepID=UPI0026394530|nr:hypothetical protein [uncultured Roseobacter sp.]